MSRLTHIARSLAKILDLGHSGYRSGTNFNLKPAAVVRLLKLVLPLVFFLSANLWAQNSDQGEVHFPYGIEWSDWKLDFSWDVDMYSQLSDGDGGRKTGINFEELSVSMSAEYREWLLGELTLELGDRVKAMTGGEMEDEGILETARLGARIQRDNTEVLLWVGAQVINFSSDYSERPVPSTQVLSQTNEELEGKSALQVQWKVGSPERWARILGSLISEINLAVFNMDSGTRSRPLDFSALNSHAIQLKGSQEFAGQAIRSLEYQLSYLRGVHEDYSDDEQRLSASMQAELDLRLPTKVYSEYLKIEDSPEFPDMTSTWTTGFATEYDGWKLMGEYTLSIYTGQESGADFTLGIMKKLNWNNLEFELGPQLTHSFSPDHSNAVYFALAARPKFQ